MVTSSGQSLSIQFLKRVWVSPALRALVRNRTKTDSGEQGQSVADVAEGELFCDLNILVKRFEPLNTNLTYFWGYKMVKARTFPRKSILKKGKNRSTSSVGGFWKLDAPSRICSEPPSPFPEVINLAVGVKYNSPSQNLQEGKSVVARQGHNPQVMTLSFASTG